MDFRLFSSAGNQEELHGEVTSCRQGTSRKKWTHLMIRMMGVMRMTDTLNDEGEQNREGLFSELI